MKRAANLIADLVAVMAILTMGSAIVVAKEDYSKTLQAIAQDIAGLKSKFPQLKEFSPVKNADIESLTISYQHHTYAPQQRAGWRSGVPNSDDDGVWFYIDLHEPDSQAQIHTQPLTPLLCLAKKRVSFLILEGKNTKSLGSSIWSILRSHGVKPCDDSRSK